MDIFEDFVEMKAELKEKWLDYYEMNRDWIKVSKISQGHSWLELIDGRNTNIYCPDSKLIIGVVSSLDKRVSEFIQISIQFSGVCYPDKIVEGLGLRFDPDFALKERAEKNEEVQEAKLLTAGNDDNSENEVISQENANNSELEEK